MFCAQSSHVSYEEPWACVAFTPSGSRSHDLKYSVTDPAQPPKKPLLPRQFGWRPKRAQRSHRLLLETKLSQEHDTIEYNSQQDNEQESEYADIHQREHVTLQQLQTNSNLAFENQGFVAKETPRVTLQDASRNTAKHAHILAPLGPKVQLQRLLPPKLNPFNPSLHLRTLSLILIYTIYGFPVVPSP